MSKKTYADRLRATTHNLKLAKESAKDKDDNAPASKLWKGLQDKSQRPVLHVDGDAQRLKLEVNKYWRTSRAVFLLHRNGKIDTAGTRFLSPPHLMRSTTLHEATRRRLAGSPCWALSLLEAAFLQTILRIAAMHSVALLFAVPLTLAVLAQCASQEPLDDSRIFNERQGKVVDKKLSSYIQSQLRAGNIVGMSMAIILPNGEVQFESWGNRTEDGDPIMSDTVFNLGSCSKAFLSASLGILMQDFADGKNKTALPHAVDEFNWNTKMHHLLPDEWAVDDQWTTEKADLKDLLSHRSGLPGHDGSYAPDDSPHDVVTRMRYLRTAYELRQFYEYNNQMYITGSYVVSKYSGSSYRDFVEERILTPLGMHSSSLYTDRAFATGRFTQSWSPVSRRRIPFFMPEHTAELIAGAAGVMSTVEDMALWVKVLLNKGVDGRNSTIIPRTTFDLATSAISVAIDTGDGLFSIAGYGLGWGRLSYRGHEVVRHSGGAPGVATIVDLYPRDSVAIVLLANTLTTTLTRNIANAVADRVLGLPEYGHYVAGAPPVAQQQISFSKRESRDEDPWPPDHSYYICGLRGPLSPGPSSRECQVVIDDFRTPSSSYARWPRFWASHLRLSPVPGSRDYEYAVQLTNLYPDGYGADRTPFEEPSAEFVAKFMMDSNGDVVGLGFFGVAQGTSWRSKRGGSMRDTADVWFDKIHTV
ncbi:beta-lactamase/transpeptidase-like protein [Mycena pura]|uniref:Beta-lactamase/transpeptidase-like protein n=1 Tax=Mycena pura TaxID=153505 RepID=A0AAD6Y9Y8_9AGAR|nr:beta-lactamase/transpeptidase-like protein [Mycena pura]